MDFNFFKLADKKLTEWVDKNAEFIDIKKNTTFINESKEIIEKKLLDFNIDLLYWRKVPTDKEILGTLAKQSKPAIFHAVISSKEKLFFKR